MQIKARYIGEEVTNGLKFGKVYHLVIRDNHVFNEFHLSGSPEFTIEEFLTMWIPLIPGD